MSLPKSTVRVPYSAVQYCPENYPALKMFFPLDEGAGLEFLDHAGGRVWRPAFIGDADQNAVHSAPYAITLEATQVSDNSEIAGLISGVEIPAPGTTKVAVLILVFGPIAVSNATDYWYFRLGGIDNADSGAMVWNVNSKSDYTNPFKSSNLDPQTAPPMTPAMPLASVGIALSALWQGGTTMIGKDQRDATVYTGTDTTASPMTRVTSVMQMQHINSGVNISQSLYSVQYWLFDALPADMTAALLWTKENVLLGNKTPYPGWAGKV